MLKLTPTWCGPLTTPGVLNLTPEFLQCGRACVHTENLSAPPPPPPEWSEGKWDNNYSRILLKSTLFFPPLSYTTRLPLTWINPAGLWFGIVSTTPGREGIMDESFFTWCLQIARDFHPKVAHIPSSTHKIKMQLWWGRCKGLKLVTIAHQNYIMFIKRQRDLTRVDSTKFF